MSRKNLKLKTLTLQEKYEIVAMHKSGKITNKAQFAMEHNIPRSTLSSIIKMSEKIISDYEDGKNSKSKRKRKHNFEDVDEPLLKWFRAARDKKLPISGDNLRLKAQQFAEACGYENPKTLDTNWIDRWKFRNEIVCKKLHGEAESVNQQAVDNWQNSRLLEILKEFEPENIFNTDETGLFFKCLPDRTHVLKHENCAGGKMSKERLTVLVSASMMGEKLPLLVIGKSAKPRCFKGVKRLPLEYKSNSKAWMTCSIFTSWLRKLDSLMQNSNRKIALVLDNCTAHPNVNGLANVKLIFLPPNTTAKTQPMDAGVIRCLKAHYRSNLAKERLVAWEENIEDFKIDILTAMNFLSQAWSAVSPVTIQNCFRKVNFKLSDTERVEESTEKSDAEAERIWEMLQAAELVPASVCFSQYTDADENLINRETITEESILSEIKEKTCDTIEEIDEEDDDEEEEDLVPPPSIKEALNMAKKLQHFMMCQEDGGESYGALTKIHSYIVDKSLANAKQSKISDFFKTAS